MSEKGGMVQNGVATAYLEAALEYWLSHPAPGGRIFFRFNFWQLKKWNTQLLEWRTVSGGICYRLGAPFPEESTPDPYPSQQCKYYKHTQLHRSRHTYLLLAALSKIFVLFRLAFRLSRLLVIPLIRAIFIKNHFSFYGQNHKNYQIL